MHLRYGFIDFLPFDPFSPIASIDCSNQSSPQSRYRYKLDWFRGHLSNYFKVIMEEELEQNRILFVCEIVDTCQDENELVWSATRLRRIG